MSKTVLICFPQHNGSFKGSMGQLYWQLTEGLTKYQQQVLLGDPLHYKDTLFRLNAPSILLMGLGLFKRLAGWYGEYVYFMLCLAGLRPNIKIIAISQEYIFPVMLNNNVAIVQDLIQAEYPRSFWIGFFYKFILPQWLRRVGVVLSISYATQNLLLKQGIKSEMVYPYLHYDLPVGGYLESTDLDKLASNVFLWIGTMARHKNINLVFELAKRTPDCKYKVVIPHGTELVDYPDNITLYSNLSQAELIDLYSKSSAFISTSLVEGYGLPAMEAAVMGLPVILSDIEIYREVHGDHAMYFNPNDVEDLVNVVQRFCAANNERRGNLKEIQSFYVSKKSKESSLLNLIVAKIE